MEMDRRGLLNPWPHGSLVPLASEEGPWEGADRAGIEVTVCVASRVTCRGSAELLDSTRSSRAC